MRVLLLGGTGAIGSWLVNILAEVNINEIYVSSREAHVSNKTNIMYLKGNALDDDFLKSIVKDRFFDAIVDFMNYKTEQFIKRKDILLDSTKQYIFLSSSRVYANSDRDIKESSNRLLETIDDMKYLSTDEYALAKARQESIIQQSGRNNYTIVRPYITYSNERMQLGILEKEHWLYRALRRHSVVFGKDEAQHLTTLTYGADVAGGIASIIGNEVAFGEIYHIMQDKSVHWGEVLELYCKTIEEEKGFYPKIVLQDDFSQLSNVIGRKYQHKYDRVYDRHFDNSKIKNVYPAIDRSVDTYNGLRNCIREFINGGHMFRNIDWKFEGYADKVSCEQTPITMIPGVKNKLKYIIARYSSYYENR